MSADGAYPAIPPRKNAEYWEEYHPRNEAAKGLKSDVLKQWKIDNDYHQRFLSETAMYRYKQLISPRLSLRDYNSQVSSCKGNEPSNNTMYAHPQEESLVPDNKVGMGSPESDLSNNAQWGSLTR